MSENGGGNENGKEGRKRPNAGYRLSKTNENLSPEDITYYYSRERRLENAPQAVQDMYYKEEPRRRGLFRAGPGGKLQLFTMIAILLVSAMALVSTLVGRESGAHSFEGNSVAIQAIRFEGAIIVTLRKSARTARSFLNLRPARQAYVGEVSVEAMPAGAGGAGARFSHRVTFTEESPQVFHFALPFDADELEVSLRTESGGISVRVVVE